MTDATSHYPLLPDEDSALLGVGGKRNSSPCIAGCRTPVGERCERSDCPHLPVLFEAGPAGGPSEGVSGTLGRTSPREGIPFKRGWLWWS